MARIVELNVDGAGLLPGSGAVDASQWGPHLRFSAPPRTIEAFYSEIAPRLAPFVVYGSGDFHHLSGLWLRRVSEPVVLVSFDNHPDWDVRPPKWCCGSWINRALELPHVRKASVWGCGNFECWWPGQLFGNRRAERRGTLEVHPWADDRPPDQQQRRGAILRDTWRDAFRQFVQAHAGAKYYVTIDLDCFRADAAVTNWENGRFSVEDVVWALGELRASGEIVAGDICGAYTEPRYARRKQRFASEMDHPKLTRPDLAECRRINSATIGALVPALAH